LPAAVALDTRVALAADAVLTALGAAAATSVPLLLTPVMGHGLLRLRLLLLGEGPLLPPAMPLCLLLLVDPLTEEDALRLLAAVLWVLLLTVLPVWGAVVLQGFVLELAGTAMRRPKATTYAWAAAGGWQGVMVTVAAEAAAPAGGSVILVTAGLQVDLLTGALLLGLMVLTVPMALKLFGGAVALMLVACMRNDGKAGTCK